MEREIKDIPAVFIIAFSLFLFPSVLSAQFADNFESGIVDYDSRGTDGWTYFTGDGNAEMKFIASGKGYASVYVDASKDKRRIWWALIKRMVSANMNLRLLNNPRYEIRAEARIRVSSAPKRVNLHLNTQRTTDFHTHLMEYDIPDTVNWHVISMTTRDFKALPGDTVYAQLALMDWGTGKYRVDIDYYKADIVKVDSVGPDKGYPIPYHPPIPDVNTYSIHLSAAHDAIIDSEYPDMNFNNWLTTDENEKINLIAADGTRYIIIRWNFKEYENRKIRGAALLELTTYSLQRSENLVKDFGMIRISEIIGGDPWWDQRDVTYGSFCCGEPLNRVINSQMIIDSEVKKNKEGKNFFTISGTVMQRLMDGKSLGIAIKSLGAVDASFYSSENVNKIRVPKIHFNLIPE